MPLPAALTGAEAAQAAQSCDEHGMSSRRYSSRTTLTHLPLDERRNT